MKIENMAQAYYIKQDLDELQQKKRLVEGGGGLGLTIQSAYQDADFEEAIRPHVLAELENRIQQKKDALAELGVKFS